MPDGTVIRGILSQRIVRKKDGVGRCVAMEIMLGTRTIRDFIVEGKRVVLIDDVLFTGRSVRAAMDALLAYGRPEKVELLVLVNRKYSRDLPIEPDYVGRNVNTVATQKVNVEWKANGAKQNSVYLINV